MLKSNFFSYKKPFSEKDHKSLKPLFYAIFEYYTGLGYFIRTTHRSRINVPLLLGPLFINFLDFSEENSIFVTIIEILKKQTREVFLKNYEN